MQPYISTPSCSQLDRVPTPGKIVFGHPGEQVIQTALHAHPIPGYVDVIAHGTPDVMNVLVDGRQQLLSATQVAELLRKHPDYVHGTPVRLLSCNTGASPAHGGIPFAQRLANELGVAVLAANTYVKPQPDGTLELVRRAEDGNTWQRDPRGAWLLFEPQVR
jgi:hypothetical protein